jgi:hypothetical protein
VEVLVRIAFQQFRSKAAWSLDRKLQAFFEAHFLPFAIQFASDNFRALLSTADVQSVVKDHMPQLEQLYGNMRDPQRGCLTIGGFIEMFRRAEVVNDVLTVSRLNWIFICSNFDEFDLADWRDWDFGMELHEFSEAVARVSVLFNMEPPIDMGRAFAQLSSAELCWKLASFLASSRLFHRRIAAGVDAATERNRAVEAHDQSAGGMGWRLEKAREQLNVATWNVATESDGPPDGDETRRATVNRVGDEHSVKRQQFGTPSPRNDQQPRSVPGGRPASPLALLDLVFASHNPTSGSFEWIRSGDLYDALLRTLE